VRRIGVLTGLTADDPETKARNAAFEQALQELGWSQGRNVRIDYRFTGGDAARSAAARWLGVTRPNLESVSNAGTRPDGKQSRLILCRH
jgi:DNA-binding LacI/PurR family transcriptional regulator